jgi:hypothetical protein
MEEHMDQAEVERPINENEELPLLDETDLTNNSSKILKFCRVVADEPAQGWAVSPSGHASFHLGALKKECSTFICRIIPGIDDLCSEFSLAGVYSI